MSVKCTETCENQINNICGAPAGCPLIKAHKHSCSGAAQLASVLRPGSSLVHPESVCSACGGPNITWTTESELWNKCNGSPNGILCPICFVRLAEKQGFDKCWRLIPV